MSARDGTRRAVATVVASLLAIGPVTATLAQDTAAARIAQVEAEIARLQAELQRLRVPAAAPAVDWQQGRRPPPPPAAWPPASRAPLTRAPLSPLERWGWGGALYVPWIDAPWGPWGGPVASSWAVRPCAPPWLQPVPPDFVEFHLPEN